MGQLAHEDDHEAGNHSKRASDLGLRLSDLLCELRLSETSILACLFQDLQENSVPGRVMRRVE